MTKALSDKLARLDDQAVKWEMAYVQALRDAALACKFHRAIEARFYMLLNLSLWVNGKL